MTIIEDDILNNDIQIGGEDVESAPKDSVEYETIAKKELEAIRKIAEDNSSNKVFYVRLSPKDLDQIMVGEKVVITSEGEYRNYIIVLTDEGEVPNDEYFQDLMVEHGKVLMEVGESASVVSQESEQEPTVTPNSPPYNVVEEDDFPF